MVLTESVLAEMGFEEYEVFIEPVSDEESPDPQHPDADAVGHQSAGVSGGDKVLRRLSARDKRVPKRFGDNDVDSRQESTLGKRPRKNAAETTQEMYEFFIKLPNTRH